jgi:hypothetical protein
MPRSRPQGRRAWLWSLHLAWIIAATVAAIASLWATIPDVLRWLIVGLLAYSALVTPPLMARTLRAYWNASQAAEENRQLIARDGKGEREWRSPLG